MQNKATTKSYDLIKCLEVNFFKLHHEVMKEVGSAAITFGGFVRMTNGVETFPNFKKISLIAKSCRINKSTARKHLKRLQDNGWIKNLGRGPRRTSTRILTDKAKSMKENFGWLPYFLLPRRLFSSAALRILSLYFAEIAIIQNEALKNKKLGVLKWDELRNIAIEQTRFNFSLKQIQKLTGISKKSAIKGRKELLKQKILIWEDLPDEDLETRTILFPNREICFLVKDCKDGKIKVEFGTLKKTPQN
jgi:hypothetical protein